ncbi:cupin domain-containing protein [Lacrimispora sp. AGF001]|uniref:cupin domain-containing protein n=1 Tax=Lacrimispora sp. AGF001 TaxID=3401631 RepID=UPI003B429926|nr:cupin domain-containing protein [Paenibacillaceae bacterium]
MNLEIYDTTDSIYVEKENHTKVNYFIFDEYEIHLNTLPPHSIQEWHKHHSIEEVIFVISGKLKILWKEAEQTESRIVSENSIVRVKNSIHTLENESDEDVRFLVYRMVPDGVDKRNIIKNDKELIL